jgi:hypothetical protein
VSQTKKLTNPDDAGASSMSIARFCQRNDISAPMFYKLKANRLGPKTINLGARTLITIESERRWRQARERRAVNVEALDRPRRDRNRSKRSETTTAV